MTTFNPNCTSAFSLRKVIEPYQSGPLDGLQFAVKDLIDTAGDITSCGNPSWHQTHEAALSHAICVEQCLGAGARCIGKTKTNELAFGLSGENDFYGTALNPNAPDRIPGGSSAGSASAVASGDCDFSLGTDTGGSVRVPASNCGVWGMRTSFGRISLAGVNPLASSFDSVGVFAKDANTLNKATRVLLGCEDQALQSHPFKRLIIPTDVLMQCDEEVIASTQAWQQQLSKLWTIETCELNTILNIDTTLKTLFEHYCAIHWCEIWSNLGGWVASHQPQLGPATEINFKLARQANRQQLFRAMQYRQHIDAGIQKLLGDDALLLLPTTPAIPPLKGQAELDRTKGTYIPRLSGLSSLAAFARSPQVSLPVAHIDGVPQGLSLMAAHGMDEALLHVCTDIMHAA